MLRVGRDRHQGGRAAVAAGSLVLPLALAQFIASYAASNMNVAITTIAADLGTTVIGMQTTITLFTLTMASLMIPGSKLTDIWGRKALLHRRASSSTGPGRLLASLAQGLGLMIIGYSLLEGVGSALMIPPIYILITVAFPDLQSRAKFFGVVSARGGMGSAAGPLIGGLITSTISWRASFLLQVLVVAGVAVAARRIVDPPRQARGHGSTSSGRSCPRPACSSSSSASCSPGRTAGSPPGRTSRSATPSSSRKVGISPVWLFVGIGIVILFWFFRHIRSSEQSGQEPAAVHSGCSATGRPTSD